MWINNNEIKLERKEVLKTKEKVNEDKEEQRVSKLLKTKKNYITNMRKMLVKWNDKLNEPKIAYDNKKELIKSMKG